MKTLSPVSTGRGAYLPPETETLVLLSESQAICASDLSTSTEVWEEVDLSFVF